MKIIIKWYDTDEELEKGFAPHEVMRANDILDAEGKLAIMARHYQKRCEDNKNIIGEDAEI